MTLKNKDKNFDDKDDLTVAYMLGYERGKDRLKANLEKELFDFFMWFRKNGEIYIDISIEDMIRKYLDDKKQEGDKNNDR